MRVNMSLAIVCMVKDNITNNDNTSVRLKCGIEELKNATASVGTLLYLYCIFKRGNFNKIECPNMKPKKLLFFGPRIVSKTKEYYSSNKRSQV